MKNLLTSRHYTDKETNMKRRMYCSYSGKQRFIYIHVVCMFLLLQCMCMCISKSTIPSYLIHINSISSRIKYNRSDTVLLSMQTNVQK